MTSPSNNKPVLVLDLDHTLLHSRALSDLLPEDAARLHFALTCTSPLLPPSLHHNPDLRRLTKFRPFVHQFLRAASSMFELYVYTMATPSYAAAMTQVLDPSGCLFEGRIIARRVGTFPRTKSLTIIPRPESSVIIIDDTPCVWQNHLPNLIAIDRYYFFSSASSTTPHPALLPALQDESESGGALARTLDVLRLLHDAWQREEKDLPKVLGRLRSRTLAGCKLAFPIASPQGDPFWRLAHLLGATCSPILDESATHVVTRTPMTLPHMNAHIVHPQWIGAAIYTWKRPSETLYAPDAVTLTFSDVTGLFIDYVCTMHDHHDAHELAAPLIDILAAVAASPRASTTSSSHHDILPAGRRPTPAPSATPP